MFKTPAIVVIFALLCACQTSCNKKQQHVDCLCPMPMAQLTISGSDGVQANAINVSPKPIEWGCYQNKKQANCNFVSEEDQASFTLLVNGYEPQALSLEITQGKHDTVCACDWMKADPSQVELKLAVKE